MAEVAVSSVIDKLVILLVYEPNILSSVRKEVASIKLELESIQSFLKDADERADTEELDGGIKTWVKKVREVSYQIEDVIDEYLLHLAEQPHRYWLIRFFYKVARCVIKLKPQHHIASQIQEIRTNIREITESRERYKLDSFDQGSSSSMKNAKWHDPRLASLFIGEDEVVGIDSSRKELIKRLTTGESRRVVISLVGMGGIGKTTLAKKLYDNEVVIGHFDCLAWIPVSQSYKKEELLRMMIKEFHKSRKELTPEGIDTMDETSLISKLREYLQMKRYVIALDDVWKVDFWIFIKHALPNNEKGSRVIISTRSDDVAASFIESSFDYIHKLQPLSQEEAWKLFCNKAFHSEIGGHCPQELKELSLEIVRRCEGLPLAIVAIGGLCSTKEKIISEWRKLCCSLGSELERNPHLTSIAKIVFLGYNGLPHYLKSCFLYLGIVPEDYSIRCGRLIRLWIAEGFIKKQQGKTLEEVAEEYLTELIHRSLVQVSEVHTKGSARSCRVHDLVREIILLKFKELSFCALLPEMNSSSIEEARRVSIHNSIDNVTGRISNSRIRSIFLYRVDDKLPKSLLVTLTEKLKLLKVLDLQDAPVDYLPAELGNLFHLAYLSLRNTKVKMLPKSIGKLHNLMTLDLKRSLVHELPIGVKRLHKLRHLLAVSYDYEIGFCLDSERGVKVQESIGHLEELQKLYHVEATDSEVGLISELKSLRQLRKLGIKKLKREDGRALCRAIVEMKHLRSLFLYAVNEDEMMDLESLSSPPQFLQRLNLVGCLKKLPEWVTKLQNLRVLCLRWSRFVDDPLKDLQALPNLNYLDLCQACDSEQLYFEAGGFQKLKALRLEAMHGLTSVRIDEGALPLLEMLTIGPCPRMKEVPSDFCHLRRLTTLKFWEMPNELRDRLKPNQGEDCWIVEHIPNISFWVKYKGGLRYIPAE